MPYNYPITTLRVCWEGPDGYLCALCPSGELPLQETIDKDLPSYVTQYRVLDYTEMPADPTFRDAWSLDFDLPDSTVYVDMDVAREIYLGWVNFALGPLLSENNDAYISAQMQSLPTGPIVADREELQSCRTDPAIYAATTPEALKACWNESLLGPPIFSFYTPYY